MSRLKLREASIELRLNCSVFACFFGRNYCRFFRPKSGWWLLLFFSGILNYFELGDKIHANMRVQIIGNNFGYCQKFAMRIGC